MSNSYNFLPPFNQLYVPGPTGYPTSIGDITRLDPYLPVFNITKGPIQSLVIDDANNYTPININGITGPTGPGLSGDPAPATPFMVVAYAQTSQGIVQFILMKGSTTYIPEADSATNSDLYFFMPVYNTIDYSRVAQIYYTNDNLSTPVDSSAGPPSKYTPNGSSANFQGVRFFDAEQIIANPTTNVYGYELSAFTTTPGDNNSYAIWPCNEDFRNNPDFIYKPIFYFNEFIEGSNPNETQLNSGQLYHPYFISGTDAGVNAQQYLYYSNDNVNYQGYGPGYPLNINYGYSNILPNITPTIEYGNDNPVPVETASGSQTWPAPIPLSVYNFPVSSINNVISPNSNNSGTQPQTNVINNVINQTCTNNPFLPCTCEENNVCANNYSNGSYIQNNINTIQAGIANFLTYQFIPFSHIKTPPNFIITDPNNTSNTSYSYVTLPYNDQNEQIPVTPLGVSGTTPYGSYPVRTDTIIDQNGGPLGPTGTTISNNSILSGWINTPLNIAYQCDREVLSTSYCGFMDYYDSLFGITYSYGTCGGTGINDPFQKGQCPSNELCVPNFKFLKSYDTQSELPFICVSGSTGVSYDNLSNYYNVFPKQTVNTPYAVGVQYGQFNNTNYEPDEGKKEGINIWIIAAIIVGVFLLIIIIVFMIRSFTKKGPDYSIYSKIQFD